VVQRDLAKKDPKAWALKAIEELEALQQAHQQHSEVLSVFSADLEVYHEISETDNRPFWGRTMVRSLFAGIEGLCYRTKHIALAAATLKNITLTSAELAMLREESYGLNDKGEAECIKSKLRTAPNLAFTLTILARARGGAYDIDINSVGWQALKKSIRVRDRITHPKNANDLRITKQELTDVMTTATWFIGEHRQIIVATPIPATTPAPAPAPDETPASASTSEVAK
jgi:hypothetical protein